MEKEIVVALIGLVSATIVPFMSSLLQRRSFDERAGEVGLLEKRVQLAERLLANAQYLEAKDRKTIEATLTQVARQLADQHRVESDSQKPKLESLSWWRKLLLAYEQPNLKASIYRAGYWIAIGFGLLGGVSATVVSEKSEDLKFAVIGGLFYIGIGFLWRSAAVRQKRHADSKLGTPQVKAES